MFLRDEDDNRDAIRFCFNAQKTLEAICFMLRSAGGSLSVREILLACYFADKAMLHRLGRPIFGSRYHAMPFGPMAIDVHDLLKGEPVHLAECGLPRTFWVLRGPDAVLEDKMPEKTDRLSLADIAAVEEGIRQMRRVRGGRDASTHGADWQKANLGPMAYEDMIEEGPDKNAKIERLREEMALNRFITLL